MIKLSARRWRGPADRCRTRPANFPRCPRRATANSSSSSIVWSSSSVWRWGQTGTLGLGLESLFSAADECAQSIGERRRRQVCPSIVERAAPITRAQFGEQLVSIYKRGLSLLARLYRYNSLTNRNCILPRFDASSFSRVSSLQSFTFWSSEIISIFVQIYCFFFSSWIQNVQFRMGGWEVSKNSARISKNWKDSWISSGIPLFMYTTKL